jgi:hypothetical protein
MARAVKKKARVAAGAAHRAKYVTGSAFAKAAVPDRLERMYKHVFESSLDRGQSMAAAARIAAATVNKHRAAHAGKKGRPKLVTKGGSRHQYYPGKAKYFGRPDKFVCLKHEKRFRTKAALYSHYRSAHSPSSGGR